MGKLFEGKEPKIMKYIPKSKKDAIRTAWIDSDGYWIVLHDEWNADRMDWNCHTTSRGYDKRAAVSDSRHYTKEANTMNETMNLLTKGGFNAADILHYEQTMAEEYAEAYEIGDNWTDNDIDYDSCNEVALDRLADYAYNYDTIDAMQEHLTAYCGRCTDEQAQKVIEAVKQAYGERA